MPPNEPSTEAMERAREVLDCDCPAEDRCERCRHTARTLDTFAEQRVRAEREACAGIAVVERLRRAQFGQVTTGCAAAANIEHRIRALDKEQGNGE